MGQAVPRTREQQQRTGRKLDRKQGRLSIAERADAVDRWGCSHGEEPRANSASRQPEREEHAEPEQGQCGYGDRLLSAARDGP